MRAFLVDGASTEQLAARFGYTGLTVASMVPDFRVGQRDFFVAAKPGLKSVPAKEAARPDRGAASSGALGL